METFSTDIETDALLVMRLHIHAERKNFMIEIRNVEPLDLNRATVKSYDAIEIDLCFLLIHFESR